MSAEDGIIGTGMVATPRVDEDSSTHYRIVDRLGVGGMGEVFLAEDLRLHRPVALKMLPPDAAHEEARERLLREARVASALSHPGIAVIYEVGQMELAGVPRSFIAMEYVAGETLKDYARRHTLEEREILGIVAEVADALAEAHRRGVVHRDVKPSNIMITIHRRVKVLDFGLAQYCPPATEDATWSGRGSPLASPGTLMGTVAYMSPEQARGRDIDARTDVFSLGAILYELLSGRLPFTGENAVEVLDALLREDPPPLARRDGSPVGPELRGIVARMLAKDRDRRYPGMSEVARDLASLRRGDDLSSLARAPGPPAVAVMSFTNITRSREDDWLGMGIAETVSADLKGVSGLTLIGRERIHEVLRTLGEDAPEESLVPDLGRAVGARFVVSGGYQRLGDAVRVTARVTDVESGAVLRTVKLDGPMSGIFELQDRIVVELAAGLRPDRAPESREPEETHVIAAYEAFAKGLINLRAESVDRAILFFEKALALDPGYARAHLHLGKALDVKGNYLFVPDLLERALTSYHKALALRPEWAEVWREVGGSLVGLGRFDEALEAIDRALALEPDNAGGHAAQARALFIGKARFAEAATAFERALRLNPQAGWYALQLAHCAALLRDYPRGEAAARRAIELQEQFFSGAEGFLIVGAYVRLGHLDALQGRYAEAIAQYERELDFLRRVDHPLRDRLLIELRQRLGSALVRAGDTAAGHAALGQSIQAFQERLHMGTDDPFTRYYAAGAHAMRGELEAAVEGLERAAAVRWAYTVERARIDPDFDALRGSPGFSALLAKPPSAP